jgi:hypothetical protein
MLVGKLLRYGAWLFLLVGMVCAGVAAWDWREAMRVGAMRADGTEVVARIMSGRRVNWKGAAAYAVNLSWTDTRGRKREARGVPVTATYAGEIVRGGQLLTLAVPIKYQPDAAAAAPVVLPDAGRRESELWARVWTMLSLALAALVAFAGCMAGARMRAR